MRIYLKELALELTPAITFLFQTSLEQGKLPNDWLQAHIVPVFKKGAILVMSSRVSNNWVSQDLLALNPCCESVFYGYLDVS
jgi:hypothetical protein